MLKRLQRGKAGAGFSLIELIITVAIIAILAAVAIPIFLNQRTKASLSNVQTDVKNVTMQVETIRPAPGVAFSGSPAASMGTVRVTPGHVIAVDTNCAFGLNNAGSIVSSPGNYIVRGYTGSGAHRVVAFYDSASGTWLTATGGFPAHWYGVSNALGNGTCSAESYWT